MRENQSRARSLATSVSLAALCIAMPALANGVTSTTVPGASLPPDYSVGSTETYVFGVTATSSTAAGSEVVSVPTGTIEQKLAVEEEDGEGGETMALAAVTPTGAALNLANAGSVSILSTATVNNPEGHAIAHAQLLDGVSQVITAPKQDVSATATNTGTLIIGSVASATGTVAPGQGEGEGEGEAVAARATSSLIGGMHQEATIEGGGDATATVRATNDELYRAYSNATASAQGDAVADATLQEAIFMRAQGNGSGDATTVTTLVNNDRLNFTSSAASTSTAGNASSSAASGGGEHGLIHVRGANNGVGADTSTVVFNNNAGSLLTVGSTATTTALVQADSSALADGAIVMKAQGSGKDDGDVSTTLNNAGTIAITAGSTATSTGAEGGADAETTLNSAIVQTNEAGGPESFVGRTGVATINNAATGSITLSGTANAVSKGESWAATELEPAILQEAEMAGVATTSFNNAGTVAVTGAATATGSSAYAGSFAGGVEHEIFGLGVDGNASANFANSGTFTVGSAAAATGTANSFAEAGALGFEVWGEPVNLGVTNSKTFTVTSSATSNNGPAFAGALGMLYSATYDPTVVVEEDEEGHGHGTTEGHSGENGQNGHGGDEEEGPVVWEEEATNAIGGSVANSGTMTVSATASGVAGDGIMTYEADVFGAHAQAGGVLFESSVNNATFTNTGTISVSAVTNGGLSEAGGIMVTDFQDSPILPTEADVFTLVNNGGTIIARESTNNGATWQHGLAIDTSTAPNRADIRFLGTSKVYGNILLSDDDAVTIVSGKTTLDGVVNPVDEFSIPDEQPTGITTFALAAPMVAGPVGPLVGSMTIANGATLFLVDQPYNNTSYNGPAGVNVNTFTVASGGTLAVQLPTSSIAAVAQAAYPYVNANTANLGGTLQAVLSPQNGLYANSYVFNDIIDAGTRNGTFSSVVTNTGSALLTPSVVYDAAANVDLLLTRVGFGAVPGLTFNQRATGNAIEAVYSPTQTGAYGTLLANLFLQTPATYPGALNQLSGDQYAGYVQGLRNNSLQVSTLVSDQMDCAVGKASFEACREPDQGVRLWALGGYNEASVDTDVNAPGYSSDNTFALLGADYTTGNFQVGAFGGYRKVKSSFDRNNGRISADGYQLGLLAGYDVGSFYIRANGSYSALNGDSRRSIGILSTTGTISGKPDFRTISVYGEAGARFAVGQTWLTPFVGAEYTKVKLNGFTETGVPGANLEFRGQSDSQTSLLAGLKWAGNFGGIVPEAKIAYRHDGKGRFFTTTQRFVDAPGAAFFTVRSPETDRNSVMAGFSLAAAFSDTVTGRIGYQGRFADNLKDNAYFGSLTVRFGSSKAPPPPPPAEMAPPPPPPPAPPPPPPPPPPAMICNKGPFIVFFDWDKSDITADAAVVLDSAVAAYGSCDRIPVMVAGYADRSGRDGYNQALSERRAVSVRGYLNTRGIDDAAIGTQGFGETNPRVPTADGVREPQNRRVEILYGPGSGQ